MLTNVNVTNIYRNARVANGISSVSAADFRQGRFSGISRMSGSQIHDAGLGPRPVAGGADQRESEVLEPRGGEYSSQFGKHAFLWPQRGGGGTEGSVRRAAAGHATVQPADGRNDASGTAGWPRWVAQHDQRGRVRGGRGAQPGAWRPANEPSQAGTAARGTGGYAPVIAAVDGSALASLVRTYRARRGRIRQEARREIVLMGRPRAAGTLTRSRSAWRRRWCGRNPHRAVRGVKVRVAALPAGRTPAAAGMAVVDTGNANIKFLPSGPFRQYMARARFLFRRRGM